MKSETDMTSSDECCDAVNETLEEHGLHRSPHRCPHHCPQHCRPRCGHERRHHCRHQTQHHSRHYHHFDKQTSCTPILSFSTLLVVCLTLMMTISSTYGQHRDGQSLNQLRMVEEKAIPKNITAQIGHPVYLHCVVEQIGDKMVSWIRLRDFHLLTVGLRTYISDDRFVVRHGTLQFNDWALQIKHVSTGDDGLYECQINSDPPRSQYYYLHVVVPVAEMIGYPDMFVKTGAIINLTCIISRSPEPPAFVFWYHNERMINYDYTSIGRGEMTVQKDTSRSDLVISRLVIRDAKLQDSGNYTCNPSNSVPTSIYVHVLHGEKRFSSQLQNDESSNIEADSGHTNFDASIFPCIQCLIIVFVMSRNLSTGT